MFQLPWDTDEHGFQGFFEKKRIAEFRNFNEDDINLTEGQRIKWFSETEAKNIELAYGLNGASL